MLQAQIVKAFFANPWLNALIVGVLCIGIILSFHQVIRLFPEVSWVNGFRRADPALPAKRPPSMLAPMASILGGERAGRVAISAPTMRAFLDSLSNRLDEGRDISRYLTGLLVFLGLLGTFWGLIETVGSVGSIINNLQVGGDAGSVFDALKQGLAAPLGGMGISFSSSLFGLAGSLVLGFLDLQTSQAQNRFYTSFEDWLATTVQDLGVGASPALAPCRRQRSTRSTGYARRWATPDRARHHRRHGQSRRSDPRAGSAMRTEQQMIRDWADEQAKLNRDLRRFMELLARETVDRASRRTNRRRSRWRSPAARRDSGMNYWPGFVDALSTLVLCVIFLLTVFMVAQFFLSQEVAGKDTALARLNAQSSRPEPVAVARTGRQDEP